MRAAFRVIQFGALAVVLAVTTFFGFELDRFFIPKELVLHATAVLATASAITILSTLPSAGVGALILRGGELSRGDGAALREALARDEIRFHPGSIRGA